MPNTFKAPPSGPFFASASAFLKPGVAPEAAVFQSLDPDDPNALRDLQPKPGTVRDAIAAFKKAGFQVAYGQCLSVQIAGPIELFRQVFDADLVADSAGDLQFADAAGKKLRFAHPRPAHPLAATVAGVSLSGRAVHNTAPPSHSSDGAAWGKEKPEQVWPHQLRMALSFPRPDSDEERLLSSGADPGGNAIANAAKDVVVAVIDSFVDERHPYFGAYDGNPAVGLHLTRGGNGISNIAPPFLGNVYADLQTPIQCAWQWCDLLLRALRERRDLTRCRLDITNSKFDERLREQTIRLQDFLVQNASSTLLYEYIAFYEMDTEAYKRLTVALCSKASVGNTDDIDLPPANPALQPRSFVKGWQDFCSARLQLIQQTLGVEVNFVSNRWSSIPHGTGMAAVCLGVARLANIQLFYDFSDLSASPYAASHLSLLAVYEAAVAWPKAGEIGVANNIVSCSFGTPEKDTEAAICNDWAAVVKRATRKNIVTLFSAGNSGGPPDGSHNSQALLGKFGAIIVGGAFRKDIGGITSIELSPQAHARGMTIGSDTYWFPDVCGFVAGFDTQGQPEASVYIPHFADANGTRAYDWDWNHSGTSGATAQAAGVCAVLRSRFPNFNARQIKALLIGSGDLVTTGTSANNVSAANIPAPNVPRLVNLSKALRFGQDMEVESFDLPTNQ